MSNDRFDVLDRLAPLFEAPEPSFEAFLRRRDRKRRNQRITAGVVGIAVFVAAVWIVTSGGVFDRSETSVVPGGDITGPAVETGPAETAHETAYLIDLNTGEMTQLPKSIAGGWLYAVSPDGTMVAYSSGGDTGTAQVFIASLDGTDVEQVTHDQRGAWAPAWSPDGAAITYTALADGEGPALVSNIFVLDLATGETSQVTNEKPTTEACFGCPLGATSPQFSSTGTSIVYDLHRGGEVDVRIVRVTGGKSVPLVGGTLGTPSPDGSTFAVECDQFADGICIADADEAKARVLVRGRLVEPKWSPDGTRISYINLEYNPDGGIFVVDVATGETTFVAEGVAAEWFDDHTLIIERLH